MPVQLVPKSRSLASLRVRIGQIWQAGRIRFSILRSYRIVRSWFSLLILQFWVISLLFWDTAILSLATAVQVFARWDAVLENFNDFWGSVRCFEIMMTSQMTSPTVDLTNHLVGLTHLRASDSGVACVFATNPKTFIFAPNNWLSVHFQWEISLYDLWSDFLERSASNMTVAAIAVSVVRAGSRPKAYGILVCFVCCLIFQIFTLMSTEDAIWLWTWVEKLI